MKMVSGYEKAYKWFSVQVLAVIAVLPLAWEYIPYDIKTALPVEYQQYIFTAFAVAGILGRMIKQGDKDA